MSAVLQLLKKQHTTHSKLVGEGVNIFKREWITRIPANDVPCGSNEGFKGGRSHLVKYVIALTSVSGLLGAGRNGLNEGRRELQELSATGPA